MKEEELQEQTKKWVVQWKLTQLILKDKDRREGTRKIVIDCLAEETEMLIEAFREFDEESVSVGVYAQIAGVIAKCIDRASEIVQAEIVRTQAMMTVMEYGGLN